MVILQKVRWTCVYNKKKLTLNCKQVLTVKCTA